MARHPSKAPQSAEAARLRRRELWQRDRAQSEPMRSAWPQVEQLRVELSFRDATTVIMPSAQSHVLNPPSRAFFRFPCPYADCDGEYDLAGVVTSTLGAHRAQAASQLRCEGVRPRNRLSGDRCGLALEFRLLAQYADATVT
jgi:hypothetical protein